MNCIEFFSWLESLENQSKRSEELLKNPHETLSQWENQRASQCSPGPVRDSESLRLFLFEGRQIVNGNLSRTAFSPVSSIGLSTDRCNYATLEESRQRADVLAEMRAAPAVGYINLSVSYLRSLTDGQSNAQAIGVYDTAVCATTQTPANASHAEAFQIIKRTNKVPFKTLQADLMEQYKDKIEPW